MVIVRASTRPHMASVKLCTLPAHCWDWIAAEKLLDTGRMFFCKNMSFCESLLSL